MKHILCATFCLLVFANLYAQTAKQPPLKQYTIEQLYNNTSVSAAGFNSDESKLLIYSNASGIYNVYELNIADTTTK
ncbi:MAG TPA: S9 family peptidase, partial [Bacteroidia bacterium]|nr:S9 family peptidase [Bacteroidia bacterium]